MSPEIKLFESFVTHIYIHRLFVQLKIEKKLEIVASHINYNSM